MRLHHFIAVSAASLLLLSGCQDMAMEGARIPADDKEGDTHPALAAAVLAGWQEVIVDQNSYSNPWGKGMGDVSGDGQPDLLFGDFGGQIYWYRSPDWKRFVLYPSNGGDDMALADIDGDGDLDVISNGGTIVWYENPTAAGGDPTATWTPHVIARYQSHDLLVGDINRDGKPDVGIREESGPTRLFLQGSGGVWTQIDLTAADNGVGSYLADMNKDGRLDVVENGYWLEQPASLPGGSWARHNFAPWIAECAVEVADINRDGRPDVFLSSAYTQFQMSWFECPPDPASGNWVQHIVGSQTGYVHRFHLVDMDRDGNLDVVFAEQQQSPTRRVGYYSNGGSGASWTLNVISTTASHNIMVGDVGADGDLDIFGINWSPNGDSRPRLWIQSGGGTPTPPPAPASLSAAAGNGSASLTWPASSGATSYVLYYRAGTTVDKASGTRLANATSPYTLPGLTNGTTYAFAVAAANASGESSLSPTATATPVAPQVPPPAPASLSAAAGNGSASLTWPASSGATSYVLYYRAGTAVDKASGTRLANATSPHTLPGLTNGTTYAFAVAAANGAGESDLSPTATATPVAPPVPPPAPASLSAAAGNGSATLTWPASSGASSYILYYRAGTTVDKQTGTRLANVTSPYALANLVNGTTYAFAVAAANASGESALSPTATATPVSSQGQAPYRGVFSIPGLFEAENYDLGGEGVAYHDSDAANQGGQYRSEGVDIFNASDGGFGYAVGSFAPGDWTEYTTNVQQPGPYGLEVRVASTAANQRLRFEWNGADITGPMLAPNTGGQDRWGTYNQEVVLPAGGAGVLRLAGVQAGNARIEYFRFVWLGQGMASAPPAGFQATVEAENASLSGAVKANTFTGYTGSGYVDFQNASGDYVDAMITVPVTTVYTLEYRYANGGAADCPLEISSNSTLAYAGLGFPPTGGWTNWSTTSVRIFLRAGDNHIRARAIGSNGANLDWVSLR
jgi:hypothetical protein